MLTVAADKHYSVVLPEEDGRCTSASPISMRTFGTLHKAVSGPKATGVCIWTHHLAAHRDGLSFRGCNRQCRRLGAILGQAIVGDKRRSTQEAALYSHAPMVPIPVSAFSTRFIWKAITAAADVVHQCLSHKFSASIGKQGGYHACSNPSAPLRLQLSLKFTTKKCSQCTYT